MKKSKLILIIYSVFLALAILSSTIYAQAKFGTKVKQGGRDFTQEIPKFSTLVVDGQFVILESGEEGTCSVNYPARFEQPKLNYKISGDTLFLTESEKITAITLYINSGSALKLFANGANINISNLKVNEVDILGKLGSDIEIYNKSSIQKLNLNIDSTKFSAHHCNIDEITIHSSKSFLKIEDNLKTISAQLNNKSDLSFEGICKQMKISSDESSTFSSQ